MKKCSCCDEEKHESQFHKDSRAKDGLTYHCKYCAIARAKKHHLDHHEQHKAKMKDRYWKDPKSDNARCRQWAREHREEIREYHRVWRATNPNHTKERYAKNKDRILVQQKAYHARNREKILAKHKAYRNDPSKKELIAKGKLKCYNEKRRNDPAFRILCNIRCRIHDALKGRAKSARTVELMGCSVEDFKKHLESLWKPGMSWDNYGEWEVDHKVPCARFRLEDPEQQRACFSWRNSQPLWWHENNAKADSLPTAPQSAAAPAHPSAAALPHACKSPSPPAAHIP